MLSSSRFHRRFLKQTRAYPLHRETGTSRVVGGHVACNMCLVFRTDIMKNNKNLTAKTKSDKKMRRIYDFPAAYAGSLFAEELFIVD